MNTIVCEDASGNLKPGTVVSGDNNIALKHKRVAMLPYDNGIPLLANTGYVQRFYGNEGWVFDRNIGERGCPIMLQVTDGCQYIYWAARLRKIDPMREFEVKGLRLVHSSDNQKGIARGLNQIAYVSTTPPIESDGGVVVYGKVGFNAPGTGLLFLELYSVAKNTKVEWVAATQHSMDWNWNP
jgi:hypothetical protein